MRAPLGRVRPRRHLDHELLGHGGSVTAATALTRGAPVAGAGAAGRWRPSEVADNLPTLVPVRDSKAPALGALLFGAPAWAAFVEAAKVDDINS
ncbi:DUF397 domain-containing protein [Streptomyces sp. Li-HN-5-11]|uniref:DUF397 domain-containing protein n=1 Tax=Streptomyces sp. Li-HN-5-11 TaxID=3075432 RepID=UPI0037DA52A6